MRARAYKIIRGPDNKKEAQLVGAQADTVVKFYRWASDAAHQELDEVSVEYVLQQGETIAMGFFRDSETSDRAGLGPTCSVY
jgi:hypothetical protein